MDTLTQFGASDPRKFLFDPDLQISLTDNFGDLRPQSSRAVGIDGGLSEYGFGRSPGEVGNVSVTFWIRSKTNTDLTPAEVYARIRNLRALTYWGVQRLYKQPMDRTQPRMFCYAEINNVPDTQNVANLPHKQMRVTLNFRVNDPKWYRLGSESPEWDTGEKWDSGIKWDGGTSARTFSSAFIAGLAFQKTNTGSIDAKPRITVIIPDGAPTTNGFVLRRIVAGRIEDELRYIGLMEANDIVEIDTQAYSCTLNGAPAFGNLEMLEPDFFRLVPGENSLNIRHYAPASALLQGQIIVRFNEVFK